MRCWSRRTFFWIFFQGNVRQSSVRCLLSLLLAFLATSAQDLNSFSTSAFPYTGLTPACRQTGLRIPGITLGICFLSHPSRQGIRPGRLLRQRRRTVDGLLRSVCPFSVTLGRHCTPRPSYRVNTTYAHTTWPNGDVSLLGLPVSVSTDFSRLAGSNSRRLRAFVENPDLSHLFEASPLSASSLSPVTPCTPTFDNHSPAVG
jgi:hypothetical protein